VKKNGETLQKMQNSEESKVLILQQWLERSFTRMIQQYPWFKLQSHTMKSMKALQQTEKRACLFH